MPVQPSAGASWRGNKFLCLAILAASVFVACSNDANAPDDSLGNYIPPSGWHGQLSSDVVCSVLKPDGTVWSWRDGYSGTLGHGSATYTEIPVQAIGLRNVVAYDQEYGAAVAVDQGGDVWFWGNLQIYLGPPNIDTNVLVPKKIAHLSGVRSISMNLIFVHLLRTDGSVWSLRLDFYAPIVIEGPTRRSGVTNATFLSKALVVTKDGKIYNLQSSQFVEEGLSNIVAAVGNPSRHVLALRSDSTVWAWGANDLGQLGNGTFIGTENPTQVIGVTDVVQISALYDYNLALKKDGSVWCWGYEGKQEGQLLRRCIPVQVNGLNNVIQVRASFRYLVMQQDGTYWTFGPSDKTPTQVPIP